MATTFSAYTLFNNGFFDIEACLGQFDTEADAEKVASSGYDSLLVATGPWLSTGYAGHKFSENAQNINQTKLF